MVEIISISYLDLRGFTEIILKSNNNIISKKHKPHQGLHFAAVWSIT